MTMLELLENVGLISAAPLIGVAILVVIFVVFKPEEKRITEDLMLFSSKWGRQQGRSYLFIY